MFGNQLPPKAMRSITRLVSRFLPRLRVLLFAVPLLTMRLFAEERRLGTLELLLTYPLTDRAIVGAKLGACLIVIGALLGEGCDLCHCGIVRIKARHTDVF